MRLIVGRGAVRKRRSMSAREEFVTERIIALSRNVSSVFCSVLSDSDCFGLGRAARGTPHVSDCRPRGGAKA